MTPKASAARIHAMAGIGHARPLARVAARPGEGPRVLVVEDHPVNREVLVLQLKLLGIAADSSENGVDALAAWARGRYAAVLADIHMPHMDGHELALFAII